MSKNLKGASHPHVIHNQPINTNRDEQLHYSTENSELSGNEILVIKIKK